MLIKTEQQLEKILQYLSEQSECSCRDICILLDEKERRVRQLLQKLQEQSRIEIIGTNGLTDVIPDFYYLATVRTDGRIKDERVKQTFLKEDIFDIGQIKMPYHNTEICIYNLERMLIELVRFRGKLPFDYYKEIIGAYRNRVETMDIAKVEEYADKFKHSDKMM